MYYILQQSTGLHCSDLLEVDRGESPLTNPRMSIPASKSLIFCQFLSYDLRQNADVASDRLFFDPPPKGGLCLGDQISYKMYEYSFKMINAMEAVAPLASIGSYL